MKRIILESPYAGDVEANVAYARQCIRDCLTRGEAPIASHLLFTQPGILRDEVPEERGHGIAAGLAWISVADAMVLYLDRGMSTGMREAMRAAQRAGLPVVLRCLEIKRLPGHPSCPCWPDCGCGTQSGPHTCEWTQTKEITT